MTSINSTPTARVLLAGRAFAGFANSLSEDQFNRQPNGKWSVADTVQHLFLSTRPVARLLTGPREILRQWGLPDGPSRSYDEIADVYQRTLATGIKAPVALSPRPDDMAVGRTIIVGRFDDVYESLATTADGWSANDLDAYVIPHPALGKLTVREMLDFTAIHTWHHLLTVQAQLT